jgi:uncharacterized membrane protein YeaQ/YmgE (transglycosylase-associated protein family)
VERISWLIIRSRAVQRRPQAPTGGIVPVITVSPAVFSAVQIIGPIFFAILIGLIVTGIARSVVKSTRRVRTGRMIISAIVGAYVVGYIGDLMGPQNLGLLFDVLGAVLAIAGLTVRRRGFVRF